MIKKTTTKCSGYIFWSYKIEDEFLNNVRYYEKEKCEIPDGTG